MRIMAHLLKAGLTEIREVQYRLLPALLTFAGEAVVLKFCFALHQFSGNLAQAGRTAERTGLGHALKVSLQRGLQLGCQLLEKMRGCPGHQLVEHHDFGEPFLVLALDLHDFVLNDGRHYLHQRTYLGVELPAAIPLTD